MLVTDSQGDMIDGIRLQSLYQGLEARIRNSRKNPRLSRMIDEAQAEIQRTREASDKAGQ